MKLRTILLTIGVILLLTVAYFGYKIYERLYPTPRIEDSPTTFIGFNHVGITVQDLDKMVDFYQKATNYTILKRIKIHQNESANKLFGQDSVGYEKVILKGPNMLLELTEFDNQLDSTLAKMGPAGPGMTHTCYQSPMEQSGYNKFKNAGVEMISRGDKPIDLGGYGVTYAYAYDPEGNMVELEQMSDNLISLQIGEDWAKTNPLWMTQVAIISPNLPQLVEYYQKVLDIKPYRIISVPYNPKFDEIADIDSLTFDAAWFGMDSQGKKLELMEYTIPNAPKSITKKRTTDLGYTFSFEVTNIQKEYKRLKELGIEFVSSPQQVEDFWEVFAHDVDGNVFSLRQPTNKASEYSLRNF